MDEPAEIEVGGRRYWLKQPTHGDGQGWTIAFEDGIPTISNMADEESKPLYYLVPVAEG